MQNRKPQGSVTSTKPQSRQASSSNITGLSPLTSQRRHKRDRQEDELAALKQEQKEIKNRLEAAIRSGIPNKKPQLVVKFEEKAEVSVPLSQRTHKSSTQVKNLAASEHSQDRDESRFELSSQFDGSDLQNFKWNKPNAPVPSIPKKDLKIFTDIHNYQGSNQEEQSVIISKNRTHIDTSEVMMVSSPCPKSPASVHGRKHKKVLENSSHSRKYSDRYLNQLSDSLQDSKEAQKQFQVAQVKRLQDHAASTGQVQNRISAEYHHLDDESFGIQDNISMNSFASSQIGKITQNLLQVQEPLVTSMRFSQVVHANRADQFRPITSLSDKLSRVFLKYSISPAFDGLYLAAARRHRQNTRAEKHYRLHTLHRTLTLWQQAIQTHPLDTPSQPATPDEPVHPPTVTAPTTNTPVPVQPPVVSPRRPVPTDTSAPVQTRPSAPTQQTAAPVRSPRSSPTRPTVASTSVTNNSTNSTITNITNANTITNNNTSNSNKTVLQTTPTATGTTQRTSRTPPRTTGAPSAAVGSARSQATGKTVSNSKPIVELRVEKSPRQQLTRNSSPLVKTEVVKSTSAIKKHVQPQSEIKVSNSKPQTTSNQGMVPLKPSKKPLGSPTKPSTETVAVGARQVPKAMARIKDRKEAVENRLDESKYSTKSDRSTGASKSITFKMLPSNSRPVSPKINTKSVSEKRIVSGDSQYQTPNKMKDVKTPESSHRKTKSQTGSEVLDVTQPTSVPKQAVSQSRQLSDTAMQKPKKVQEPAKQLVIEDEEEEVENSRVRSQELTQPDRY